MEKEKKKDEGIKVLNIKETTICDATAQMLKKAEGDGVETAFHRANTMKACPIGSDSACCKHCSMGPCRLNPKDPYGKVGVCGATIDTIMARNFARMVASGAAAHTDHGMSMLDVFREVVNGDIKDYAIKDPIKLEEVAKGIGIEVNFETLESAAWTNRWRNFQWEGIVSAWYLSADPSLTSQYLCNGPNNMTGLCDPELDVLLLASDRSLNFAIRKQHLDEAQAYLGESSRMLPIYYNVIPEIVSTRVENYRGSGTNFGSFWNLYEWQLSR